MMEVLPPAELYIDGVWVVGTSGRSYDVVNPADDCLLGRLPLAGTDDLDRAISAANRAFPAWRNTAPAIRTAILVRAGRLIRRDAGALARLTTLELGLPLRDALALVTRAAEVLEWDANEGRRLYGRIIPSAAGFHQSVVREPFGPVAAFAPWNGSVFTPCRKIGSALAAGCTIVLKPAEETPFSAIALVRLFEEAGVPPGVINLIYGEPANVSRQLIQSPLIRFVTFTGSVPVGKHLARLAAAEMKPTIMELGGHAPVIICADADVEAAAERLVDAKYFSAGQVCLAPSRVLVEDAVHDAVVEKVVERVERIRLGNGLDPDVAMGPLANHRRLEAVEALVQDAKERGATLKAGGQRVGNAGCFYPATVLTNVPEDTRILREEPFGPVLAINRVSNIDKALQIANSLPFGLAAYAFTRSSANADRISRGLDCGVVGINHFGVSIHGLPFGGVKDSGHGREGGTEGVIGYTYAKAISHRFD